MGNLSVALLKAGALIQRLEDHGLLEDRQWAIYGEPHSPWVRVDAEPHPIDDVPAYHFAIWCRTGALYAVGPDGAVGDDPISVGDVQP